MTRTLVWRIISLLALVGSMLQFIGFFLPYSSIRNTATNTLVEADAYWSPLAYFITGPSSSAEHPPSIYLIAFSLFVLASMLVLFVAAFAGVFKQSRWFVFYFSIPGLVFALLDLLLSLFWSFASASGASLCVGNDCVLTGDIGSGFLPLCIGFLLSIGCFIVLIILGSRTDFTRSNPNQ